MKVCPPLLVVGNLLKEGVHGLSTNLIIFSQNHWDAAYHKSWLTGVWHCQKCLRTHLCTNSGVVSFEIFGLLSGSHLTVNLEFWWLCPEPVVFQSCTGDTKFSQSEDHAFMSQSVLFLYEDFNQELTRSRDPNLKGNLDKLGLWGWLFYSLRSLNFFEPQSPDLSNAHNKSCLWLSWRLSQVI